jgi:hypothetical protein
MGYRANELFYGVETPAAVIAKIKKLESQISRHAYVPES